MSKLYKLLEIKEKELVKLISQVKKVCPKAPDGMLRFSKHGHKVQCYLRTTPSTNGKYLPQKDMHLARDIAQKTYDESLLKLANKQLGQIQRLKKNYKPKALEHLYDKMSSARKELVTPRLVSDEQFIEEWIKKPYKGKSFASNMPEIYTDRGERVRSKSEKIIADYLYKEGIPYRYECPIHLKGMGTIHPDFTILDVRNRKEIYHEHFGMMDDEDYCVNAIRRINCYIKNGYLPGERFMMTFESGQQPIDIEAMKDMMSSLKF